MSWILHSVCLHFLYIALKPLWKPWNYQFEIAVRLIQFFTTSILTVIFFRRLSLNCTIVFFSLKPWSLKLGIRILISHRICDRCFITSTFSIFCMLIALPFISTQFTTSLNCRKKGTGQQAEPQNIEAEREKVKIFKIHCHILCISEILIMSEIILGFMLF